MATSFLTNLTEEEFKNFLKQALLEILKEHPIQPERRLPDVLDIKQAAAFLKLQITTLYEKTSQKIIPHFKKGNRLYFQREALLAWVQGGKVKTSEEVRDEAITYTLHKNSNNKR